MEELTPKELTPDQSRQRIEQEDNLINHRVSWLIGSQSFLLTAFVLLRNNPSYYPESKAGVTLTLEYIQRTDLLIYVIIIAGALIALCSSLGVLAAFMAISSWRSKVKAADRQFLTSNATLAHFGGLAAMLPGPMFASIWVMLFTAEWPNLSTQLNRTYLITPVVVFAITFLCWLGYTIYTYRAPADTKRKQS